MRTTKHAQLQQQRRGIDDIRIDLAIGYGGEHKATGHANMYRIERKELLYLESECPAPLWRRYRDTLNRTVPVINGDVVVTSMNRYRRIKRLK